MVFTHTYCQSQLACQSSHEVCRNHLVAYEHSWPYVKYVVVYYYSNILSLAI